MNIRTLSKFLFLKERREQGIGQPKGVVLRTWPSPSRWLVWGVMCAVRSIRANATRTRIIKAEPVVAGETKMASK